MLARTPLEDILFDRETVLGFLGSKDPNEEYRYTWPKECAFAQFLNEQGTDPAHFYTFQNGNRARPPGVWHEIVSWHPQTFGAALERARKLLK